MKQGHWHEVDGRGLRQQGRLHAWVRRKGCWWPACRSTASCGSRTVPGKDAERGVNVGDEWTYRSFIAGGDAGRRHLDLRGHRRGAFPGARFPTAMPLEMTIEVFRTYKGDIEKRILGSLLVRNPEDRPQGRSAELPGQEVRHRRAVHPPHALGQGGGQGGDVRPVPRLGRRREAGGLAPVPGGRAVFRHGPGRRLPPRPRRLVRAELRQGLRRHLAADGAGDGAGRDVQHVPQRAGGPAGHAGRRGRRPVQRLHGRAGLGQGDRRRAVRVAYPHRHPAEHGLRAGAGPANHAAQMGDRVLEGLLWVLSADAARLRPLQFRRLRGLRLQHQRRTVVRSACCRRRPSCCRCPWPAICSSNCARWPNEQPRRRPPPSLRLRRSCSSSARSSTWWRSACC